MALRDRIDACKSIIMVRRGGAVLLGSFSNGNEKQELESDELKEQPSTKEKRLTYLHKQTLQDVPTLFVIQPKA